jgi:hypothetical protein
MTRNEFEQRAAIAMLSNPKMVDGNGIPEFGDIAYAAGVMAETLEKKSDFVVFEEECDDTSEIKGIIQKGLYDINDRLDEIRKGTDGIGEK